MFNIHVISTFSQCFHGIFHTCTVCRWGGLRLFDEPLRKAPLTGKHLLTQKETAERLRGKRDGQQRQSKHLLWCRFLSAPAGTRRTRVSMTTAEAARDRPRNYSWPGWRRERREKGERGKSIGKNYYGGKWGAEKLSRYKQVKGVNEQSWDVSDKKRGRDEKGEKGGEVGRKNLSDGVKCEERGRVAETVVAEGDTEKHWDELRWMQRKERGRRGGISLGGRERREEREQHVIIANSCE